MYLIHVHDPGWSESDIDFYGFTLWGDCVPIELDPSELSETANKVLSGETPFFGGLFKLSCYMLNTRPKSKIIITRVISEQAFDEMIDLDDFDDEEDDEDYDDEYWAD